MGVFGSDGAADSEGCGAVVESWSDAFGGGAAKREGINLQRAAGSCREGRTGLYRVRYREVLLKPAF